MPRRRPIPEEENIGFRDRVRALGNLPAFFRLVWNASPSYTVTNILLRLSRAAMPVVILHLGKLIIDEVVHLRLAPPPRDLNPLWTLIGLEFAAVIVSSALARAISLFDGLLGDLFANKTSVEIMRHAATLDLEQFEDSVFYDKLERARQQTVGRTVLLSQVLNQVQDLITMAFLSAGLIAFNPWLILLLLVAVVPAFLNEARFNNRSYALNRGQTPERRELDYIRYVGASDETAKEIKMFGLSDFFTERFRQLSEKFYRASKALNTRRTGWGLLFAIVGGIGYYSAYVVIVWRTVAGELTLGNLTFLTGSFSQMRGLLENVLSRFTSVSQGAIYLKDLFEFFRIRPQIDSGSGARPFPKPMRTGFVFENVGFQYLNSDRWANRHLNFHLRPGEKLALVGENGAGKTTLVKLLARLYDPTEGRILLDGIDLREYDLADLRRNIGVIFQDYLRFQMSFAQNIAAGNIGEIDNRPLIETSARQSLADTVAARLAGRYDQMLGRRFANGVDLSGGEWQKIALARAYMRDSQLLILDEPTAALDARAEYQVFQRFSELTLGKTAVLISHRFSTVRMADRILVLDKGELAEIGSHEELLASGKQYAELFRLQAEGYR